MQPDLGARPGEAAADRPDADAPLYALPTYTAMLSLRELLVARGEASSAWCVSSRRRVDLARPGVRLLRADLPLWRELAEHAPRAGIARGSSTSAPAPAGWRSISPGRASRDGAGPRPRPARRSARTRPRAATSRPSAPMRARSSCRRQDFDLCLVPMQTVQLLGGSIGSGRFLRRARAHLRPGGLLAVRDRHRVRAVRLHRRRRRALAGDRARERRHLPRAARSACASVERARVLIERERRIAHGEAARSTSDGEPRARRHRARPRQRGRARARGRSGPACITELRPRARAHRDARGQHGGDASCLIPRPPRLATAVALCACARCIRI